MMTKSKWLLIACLAPLLSISIFLLVPPSIPTSPLVSILSSQEDATPGKSAKTYEVLGFLPYWNTKKATEEALTTSTQIAYFALHLNGDGSLATHVNRREQEPGYTNYKRYLANPSFPSTKLVLTFMQMDQDALSTLLASATSRRQAIRTIVDAVNESGAVGVNVDFEPLGESFSYRDEYTAFIQDLAKALPSSSLSISVYPSAVSRPRLWDLPALDPFLDHLVIMAYDYTLPGSSKVGPIAPLRGAGQLFEHDIIKNLAEITAVFPSHKILLGIPFYGYEWDTDVGDKYTPTEGRGTVASLERVQQMLDNQSLELVWDRNTLSPYGIRREDGEIVSQIYFEDINSIRLKLGLVREANLGGIAIWAIGYEGNNSALWDTIASYLLLAGDSPR